MTVHYGRRTNTGWALHALAEGIAYAVTRKGPGGTNIKATVHPGAGCVRMLQMCRVSVVGGLIGAEDSDGKVGQTKGTFYGQHPGGARFEMELRVADDVVSESEEELDEPWMSGPSEYRPTDKMLHAQYAEFLSCGRNESTLDKCGRTYCALCNQPAVGARSSLLQDLGMDCRRYGSGATARQTSGLLRWRGGDVRRSRPGTLADRRKWAHGPTCGEDVEIYCTKHSRTHGVTGIGNVTIGRILYFFDHKHNRADVGDPDVRLQWVVVLPFKTVGAGEHFQRDNTCEHPLYYLSRGTTPEVYPSDAIRRHVHMYHMCPHDGEWACGPGETTTTGATGAWEHKYKALVDQAGNDHYILNEHANNVFRDPFADEG